MSRLDWKRGRFQSDDFETQEIHRALRGFQSTEIYDEFQYYRFDGSHSQMHDVYDEGTGVGRVFRPPVTVPALHVNHDEGENQNGEAGFYFNDSLYIECSFDQLYRTGLLMEDIKHETYLNDRIWYDWKIFRVTHMHVMGQVRERDITVSIECTEIKRSEMVNDSQFNDRYIEQTILD